MAVTDSSEHKLERFKQDMMTLVFKDIFPNMGLSLATQIIVIIFSFSNEHVLKLYIPLAIFCIAGFFLNGLILIVKKHKELKRVKKVRKTIAQKDYKKAIEMCSKKKNKRIMSARLWNAKGLAFYHLQRYYQALSCFDLALKRNANYLEARTNRGGTLLELEQYEEASKDCNKVNIADPKNKIAWYNNWINYFNLHDYNKALSCLRKALEIKKKDLIKLVEDGKCRSRGRAYMYEIENYEKKHEHLEKNFVDGNKFRLIMIFNMKAFVKESEERVENNTMIDNPAMLTE